MKKDERGKGFVRDVCFVGVAILYKVEVGGKLFIVSALNNGISEGDRVRLRALNYICDRIGGFDE
jgi:hypothetical protein